MKPSNNERILMETGLLLGFLIFLVSEHYLIAGILFGFYNLGILNFENFQIPSKSKSTMKEFDELPKFDLGH